MSIEAIEHLTKLYAADRTTLVERMQRLDDELRAVKRRLLPGIKRAVADAKASQANLHAAIDAERVLFTKPRTRILHGIKVGLQKGKGKISYADGDKVVALIKKHLPEQAEVLIITEEKPVKTALLNLPAADLKRIGCTVTGTGDAVVIAPTDSEIDKLVEALLADQDKEQDDDQA